MTNNKDITARWFAGIALLSIPIAALALYFSWYQYNLANIEKVNITISKPTTGYITEITEKDGSIFLISYWKCIIDNLSEKTVSIHEPQILVFDYKNKQDIYTFLNLQAYNTTDSTQKRIKYPVNIPSGMGEEIFLKVGIRVDNKAADILLRKYKMHSYPYSKDVEKYLYEKHLDVYGNSITDTNNNLKYQKFQAIFISSKGKQYIENFAIY